MEIIIERKQFEAVPPVIEDGAEIFEQELAQDAPGTWAVRHTAIDENGTRSGNIFIDGPANATDAFFKEKILEAYGITPVS
jgi:hypothetical protein